MSEVELHQYPSHFPSTTRSFLILAQTPMALFINSPVVEHSEESHLGGSDQEEEKKSCGLCERKRKERDRDQGDQPSILELLVADF
ncbi:hypothetical protein TIFTF001_013994 [Ficus carica]|uniref:Uncharacterized protein n=1 Tax=Ficus carica TaxID=3494 RepID=A0AA88D3M0_FICCA|nr:hypothetical protein TIFTF001_013994 [Ficus carica]